MKILFTKFEESDRFSFQEELKAWVRLHDVINGGYWGARAADAARDHILELAFEKDHVRVRGFDPGEHRSSFEAEIAIGQARAFLEPVPPLSRLRVMPGALRDAALEAATASEVCAHAKEGARDALLANRLPAATPTIQRSTASPILSPGRFASYISSTVIRLLLTFPGLRSRFDDSCSHIAITPHVQISYDAA